MKQIAEFLRQNVRIELDHYVDKHGDIKVIAQLQLRDYESGEYHTFSEDILKIPALERVESYI